MLTRAARRTLFPVAPFSNKALQRAVRVWARHVRARGDLETLQTVDAQRSSRVTWRVWTAAAWAAAAAALGLPVDGARCMRLPALPAVGRSYWHVVWGERAALAAPAGAACTPFAYVFVPGKCSRFVPLAQLRQLCSGGTVRELVGCDADLEWAHTRAQLAQALCADVALARAASASLGLPAQAGVAATMAHPALAAAELVSDTAARPPAQAAAAKAVGAGAGVRRAAVKRGAAIVCGPRTFVNMAACRDAVYALIKQGPSDAEARLGGPGWRVPDAELPWFIPFLERNPSATAQMEFMSHLVIRQYRFTEFYKPNRAVLAVFPDGSEACISFIKAFEAKVTPHRESVNKALRLLVANQAEAYKQRFRHELAAGALRCPVLGEVLTASSVHVDHAGPPFISIVVDFLDRHGLTHNDVLLGSKDGLPLLLDDALARSFERFHAEAATFRLLSRSANARMSHDAKAASARRRDGGREA